MSERKTVVIIPVYNHGTRIAAVISGVLALGYPLIVVDDGSTDATPEILKQFSQIKVCTHPHNRGKGAALETGFNEARKSYTHTVTIDGDGQHDPGDIQKLLSAANLHPQSIIIGRRQGMEENHVPWTSRFGRSFSNFWVWVSGGPLVSDSQSGFRLYPLAEISSLKVRARRYQYEVEVLVKACRNGISVKETPVRVVYQHGDERISHFHPWRDFLRNSNTFRQLIVQRIFRIGM